MLKVKSFRTFVVYFKIFKNVYECLKSNKVVGCQLTFVRKNTKNDGNFRKKNDKTMKKNDGFTDFFRNEVPHLAWPNQN